MRRTLHVILFAGLLTAPVSAQDKAQGVKASAKPAKTAPKPAAKAKPAKKKLAPSVALARLSGSYADLAEGSADITSLLLGGGGKPKPFYELIENFREFSTQSGSPVMLLDLTGGFSMNLVQVREMERCLREVRKSGKKIYAYLENAGSVQMQLAAQCDHVILADMGLVELPSVSISVMFMKDAMDLLGVQMEVVRCGHFKGAVEPFVLSSMSKHLRKHYLAMIGKMNDDVVRRIATGRGLTHGKVRQLQEQRLITAKQALEVGLVDELVPWIGATKAFAKISGGKSVRFKSAFQKPKRQSINFFAVMTNLLNPKKDKEADIEDGLVVLHLSGGIVDGTTSAPGSIVSGPTVKTINQIAKDKNAKAVVVRINSPGGSATASEAIMLALKNLAKKKPVVFSMGSVAASGGYYVTCIGRPIFAEAGTITGSIGVFSMKPSLGALMRRVGLHEEIVGLDGGAEMMSMEKAWSSEHKAVLQNFVDEIYDRFTGHVSASRGMSVNDVLKIAGGRVWSGEQAVTKGLVDHIGGLDAAMAMVAKQAKLGKNYEVNHLPDPVDPMDAMVRSLVGVRAALPSSTLQLIAKRAGGLDSALRILMDALTTKRPTHVWMMMPEGIQIR